MQDKDQIAELFKDTFNNYEAPVRPELWQQVASKIQTPAAPSVPDGSSVAQMAAASSKISIITWVTAAAVVVSAVTGYYLYKNEQSSVSGNTQTEQQVPVAITPTPEILDATEIVIEPSITATPSNSKQTTNKTASGTTNSTRQIAAGISPTASPEIQSESVITTPSVALQEATTGSATAKKETTSNNSVTSGSSSSTTPENQTVKIKIQALPASGYAPLEVNFSTSGTGEINEWQFGDGAESVRGAQVRHTFSKPGTYLVTYKNTDESGKFFTELVKIEVLSDLTITRIPNIFTPNDDGVNDVFEVVTDKDIDIEVSIFDKSGKFVHKYSGVNNSWNGKINNLQDAGEGTYFYVIFATGKNGEKNTQKGTITLKR